VWKIFSVTGENRQVNGGRWGEGKVRRGCLLPSPYSGTQYESTETFNKEADKGQTKLTTLMRGGNDDGNR